MKYYMESVTINEKKLRETGKALFKAATCISEFFL